MAETLVSLSRQRPRSSTHLLVGVVEGSLVRLGEGDGHPVGS
jgi:hypothetical protein